MPEQEFMNPNNNNNQYNISSSKKRKEKYKKCLKKANTVRTKSNLKNLSLGVSKIVSQSNIKKSQLIKELLKLQSNVYRKLSNNIN